MNFLLPNFSCLQNSSLGGYRPPDPSSLCPQLNLLNPPTGIKFLGKKLHIRKFSPRQQKPAAASHSPQHRPLSHDPVHCTHTVTRHCTLHSHCHMTLYTPLTLSHHTVHCTHTVNFRGCSFAHTKCRSLLRFVS